MKKRLLSFILIMLMSVSFVSAGFLGDWWESITGRAVSSYGPVSLTATHDVWLEDGGNKNNYDFIIIGKQETYTKKRSVLKFDLSSIPSDAQISSATLKIYHSFAGCGGTGQRRSINISVNQVLKSWSESTATANSPWSSSHLGFGADASVAVKASANVSTDYGWKTFDISSLTQNWVDGSAPNYGVLLWSPHETLARSCDRRFHSSEYSNFVLRPKLVITYTIEEAEPTTTTVPPTTTTAVPQITCTDSDVTGEYPDGKNPYVNGTITFSNGTSLGDKCGILKINANRLTENYCVAGNSDAEFFNCPNGCVKDACIDTTPSQPENGTYSIVSNPSGATIYIDDVIRGTTPKKVGMEAGSHDINVSMAGYQDWTKSSDLSAGQIIKYNVVLVPVGQAVTTTTTVPPTTTTTQPPGAVTTTTQPPVGCTDTDATDKHPDGINYGLKGEVRLKDNNISIDYCTNNVAQFGTAAFGPQYNSWTINDGLVSTYSAVMKRGTEMPIIAEIDLGVPREIDKVVINSSWTRWPVDYQIKEWDGTDWNTIVDITDNNPGPMNPLVIHSFDPVSTSKVKLSVDKTNWYMNGYYLLSISEFEVHEVFDGGSVRSARLAEFYCSDPLGLRMVEFYECPSGCDNLMSACVTSEGSARVARGITDIITCTDGCLEGGDCYRYGIRYKGEYCPIGGKEMIGQLGGTQICENDFECISNVCVDGECTEPGLFQQFLEWLRDSWVGNLIT